MRAYKSPVAAEGGKERNEKKSKKNVRGEGGGGWLV